MRIRCAMCPDFDLCIECFSVGAEVTPHKSNHPYRVMVPGGDNAFLVSHCNGNLYVYEKNIDSAGDSSFPVVKDQSQFFFAHARYNKSNPIARWHISQGSINSISFSMDGAYLATIGRDGMSNFILNMKYLLVSMSLKR